MVSKVLDWVMSCSVVGRESGRQDTADTAGGRQFTTGGSGAGVVARPPQQVQVAPCEHVPVLAAAVGPQVLSVDLRHGHR
ncbi:hypothetical protein BIV57_00760 [Mangrovactinospora gilvigrisea]|uniref:Uncharacterized protein n=1 Tax=Mangrovactinospora gilvigrisea TaxID=1428644 RepID=A0A1J7BLD2_9ACTN|nr:hypothetical protein BIV57_00760 [Mangrovactinospora gilvigrisea]